MPVLQTWASASVNAWRSWGVAASPGAYELISTTVLGSSAASVTFSGLGTSAAAYKHLQIRLTSRVDSATNLQQDLFLQLNGDSANNYSQHQLYGNNGSAGSSATASTNKMYLGTSPTSLAPGSDFGAAIADIVDFQNTSKNKTMRSLAGEYSGTGVNAIVMLLSSAWYSTSAITSLTILPSSSNIVAGSRFSLYGIRG
jgi:hypothetical protein